MQQSGLLHTQGHVCPLPPLGAVCGSRSRSAPGESWTPTDTSSDWSWTLQERPPWRWPRPWDAGSRGADPVAGGCGARALRPCLGLLGPQEPSPGRRMGSGMSTKVGSAHQCQRDRGSHLARGLGKGAGACEEPKFLLRSFWNIPPDPKLSKQDPDTTRGGGWRGADSSTPAVQTLPPGLWHRLGLPSPVAALSGRTSLRRAPPSGVLRCRPQITTAENKPLFFPY